MGRYWEYPRFHKNNQWEMPTAENDRIFWGGSKSTAFQARAEDKKLPCLLFSGFQTFPIQQLWGAAPTSGCQGWSMGRPWPWCSPRDILSPFPSHSASFHTKFPSLHFGKRTFLVPAPSRVVSGVLGAWCCPGACRAFLGTCGCSAPALHQTLH